jgi:hypothetical protein
MLGGHVVDRADLERVVIVVDPHVGRPGVFAGVAVVQERTSERTIRPHLNLTPAVATLDRIEATRQRDRGLGNTLYAIEVHVRSIVVGSDGPTCRCVEDQLEPHLTIDRLRDDHPPISAPRALELGKFLATRPGEHGRDGGGPRCQLKQNSCATPHTTSSNVLGRHGHVPVP